MSTIAEWRLLLAKSNSMYAPIDIIADWEGQVADLTGEISELKELVKQQEILIIDLKEEVDDFSRFD